MAQYARDLEAQLAQKTIQERRLNPEEKPMEDLFSAVPDAMITPEKAEKIFQDPAGFVNELTQTITKSLDIREENKNKLNAFWDDFYSRYPELKTRKKVVELMMKENFQEVGHVPLHEAKKLLHSKTVSFINEMGGQSGRQEQLPVGPAVTLNSSNGQVTRLAPAPQVETSFMDEFNDLRAKRRAARN
jgi:hypothetical protein